MSGLEEIEGELEMDTEEARGQITDFIEDNVEEAGVGGTVIGLSGGLDSATAAFLCAEAVGSGNLLTVFMPEEGITGPDNAGDARDVADSLGVELREIEISPILDEFKSGVDFDEGEKVALGNMKARTRMVILYYYANLMDYLVVGPGNRSEIRCGYFTKYGDGAADILPLGSLYKTQVREVAGDLGVPKEIVEKAPSADLWEGQDDMGELGLTYDVIDRLYTGLDLGLGHDEIAEALGIEESEVREFEECEESSKHKLQTPPIPDI